MGVDRTRICIVPRRAVALVAAAVFWAAAAGAAPAGSAPASGSPASAPPADMRADTVERHELETRALSEPEAVLAELVPALRDARIAGDHRQMALLHLARANACRVIADWDCQGEAGALAASEAKAADEPLLEARGLIAEARARLAVQDYARGERLLGEAQLILQDTPHPELMADVFLAWSSMSYTLGKHTLAAEYAENGLALLGPGEGLAMQARLQRNLARALAQQGRADEAGRALEKATGLAERLADPKLGAELYLEAARLARLAGDVPTQRVYGERILTLAERLRNSQLAGLGHEVMGLAAGDAGESATAVAELRAAQASFRSLDLQSDELRVLRDLVQLLIRVDADNDELPSLMQRLLRLDAAQEATERTQAAGDFDARLRYAERENQVIRLQAEGEMARQREQALAQANRLSRLAIALGVAMLAMLGVLFALQRRGNRRLRELLSRLGRSELEYRTLADNSSDLIVRMALDGRLLYVSPSVRELLGREPEEVAELRGALLHAEDRERVRDALKGVVRDGGPLTIVYRAQHRSGHYVWLESLARRVAGPEGEPEIVYSSRDVSTRIRVEKALAASQARLRAVADNIPAMISHIDTQERYTFVNGFAGQVFSQSEEATLGRTVREVRGEEIYSEIRHRIAEALRGERVSFEGQADVGGQSYHYQTNYAPDRAPDGSVQGFFSFTFDITQLKRAEQELERQARIDGLTGLANRRHFDERTASAVARHRRSGTPLALLYLDIDRFKAINDGHGHAAGDAVLREFARRLKACVREGDLVARIGGDEFVVLVEGPESLPAVEAMAAKLVRAMDEPIALPDGPLAVGTSIGIGYSHASAASDRLVAAADEALYAAKDAGRGCWRIVEID